MTKRFIDLFAGCGGLSLGLIKAGWQGVFAIEKSPDAFQTLKHNLVDKTTVTRFDWPEWLPCEATTTAELIQRHETALKGLNGSIDLIAGGPPCQGFSFAGRRNPNDPRNQLTNEYIKIVEWVQPKFLLLENVRGFASAFKANATKQIQTSDEIAARDDDTQGADSKPYSEVVRERLEGIGYTVHRRVLNASMFGVPQARARFIMVAVLKSLGNYPKPFDLLDQLLPELRAAAGVAKSGITTVKQAISDLETAGAEIVPSVDTNGFTQISYGRRGRPSSYQQLMRSGLQPGTPPNSMRLPNHKPATIDRFRKVLDNFPKGKSVKKAALEQLGTNKHAFTPLHPERLSSTITTLPDDLLHYSEPRILTVRENARIQSFPDWFDFQGKYTTGGPKRKEECPRYSQVGNAVPPLMAEIIGRLIGKLELVDD